jgi:hypothetical protein
MQSEIEKHTHQSWGFEVTGLGKASNTPWLTGMGPH